MKSYQVCWSAESGAVLDNVIHCLTTGQFIPFDPANTDYQEYLTWLAEGNEPLPADEPS